MEKSTYGMCQHCNLEEGQYMINPYTQDVEGREEWEYICFDCYENMLGDI